jgi:signal recognition particle subunit SRP54
MGDVMSLIEKAESLYEEEEALRLQKKMMENQFTLQDFLEQLQKIRRMGPITKVMGMIPGFSKMQLQGAVNDQEIETRIKKVEAILNSMTKEERNKPKILDASRRKRIARGSGVEVRDVNDVIKQYRQMQTMMEQLRKGKFPKIPGMQDMGF